MSFSLSDHFSPPLHEAPVPGYSAARIWFWIKKFGAEYMSQEAAGGALRGAAVAKQLNVTD